MLNLPGFRISHQVSHNSKRVIFRGVRTIDNLPVLLKSIPDEYPSPTKILRLKHESTIARNLNIPGIVKALTLINSAPAPVIVLEDFDGILLKDLLSDRRFTLREFLEIMIQLTETLSALHQQNIIHRDLNPYSILINPTTLQVKIVNFMCAASQLATLNQVMRTTSYADLPDGNLAYVSPEQTGRMNRSVDYRTDFYSLGITCYELLTGHLPFDQLDALELVHCHIARQPADVQEVNPDIPVVLSDLVMKLMAKNAEERYQTAWGLKSDLQECLRLLVEDGDRPFIPTFPLAEHDLASHFQIPAKVYGRDRQLQQIEAAFERTSTGAAEMLWISGQAGLGKTTLIKEACQFIAQQRGYFMLCKFDQYQRNIPYGRLIAAFSEFIRTILTETEAQLQRWREILLENLAGNGQVIVDIMPELEIIIGKQPSLPALGAIESQNRFNLVFQNFARAFCRIHYPLAIFFDGLQWADPTTLNLLELIMMDNQIHSLLLVGAYRPSKVTLHEEQSPSVKPETPTNSANHSDRLLLATIARIEAMQSHPVSAIDLPAWQRQQVVQLLADTLHTQAENVEPLAEVVLAKTLGNPLFVIEFIQQLAEQKVIQFNAKSISWRWDLSQAERLSITDNAVDLMVAKLQKLPTATHDLLQVAACVGDAFGAKFLGMIVDCDPAAIENQLIPATKAGLLVQYYLIETSDQKSLSFLFGEEVEYRFAHDRVQKAAYALLEDQRQQQLHLQIGRVALAKYEQHPTSASEQIFDIVEQLNLGQELVHNRQEKHQLARLNLLAGQRAKQATAYALAINYFQVGTDILLHDCWQTEYQLAFELFRDRAECEYLCGNFAAATEFFQLCLEHAQNVQDRIDIYIIQLVLWINQNRNLEAIDLGRDGLQQLGLEPLPRHPDRDLILQRVNQIKAQIKLTLSSHNLAQIENLVDLPNMQSPTLQQAMKLMQYMAAAAIRCDRSFYILVILAMVQLSLEHGNCGTSVYAYSAYGSILGAGFNEYENGHQFGKAALALSDKFSTLAGISHFSYGGFIGHWRRPFSECLQYLIHAFQLCAASGELLYAVYTLVLIAETAIISGTSLGNAFNEVMRCKQLAQQRQYEAIVNNALVMQQYVLCLQGQTDSVTDFSDRHMDEASLFDRLHHSGQADSALSRYYIYKAQLHYLFEQYDHALEWIIKSRQIIDIHFGVAIFAEHFFYESLILAAIYDSAELDERRDYSRLLKHNERRLARWSQNCPANFRAKHLLLKAEIARICNRQLLAINLYDEAIAVAKQYKFIQIEALGLELAAKFWLAQQKFDFAQLLFKKAYYTYQIWGAAAKVSHLETAYAQMLATTFRQASKESTDYGHGSLDIATVVKAAQTISSEIVVDKLLAKLMVIMLETAGASRGCLVLLRQQSLYIEAEAIVNQPEVARPSIPVAESDYLPLSIINYVARVKEPVLLDNALQLGRFTQDPQVQAQQMQSVLCLPIINQGKFLGLLYLDNNLVVAAFTPERREVLQILCAQVAISLENAKLYEEQGNYSRLLEQTVAERTKELEQEIHERKRAETALQASEAELRALFAAMTDVIFVTDANGNFIRIAPTNPKYPSRRLDEIVGQNMSEFFPDRQALKFRTRIQQTLNSQATQNIEYEMNLEGRKVWFAAILSPISRTEVIWVARDITDRKLSEQALQESMARLESANQEITLLSEQLKAENLRMNAELNITRQLQQMMLPKEAELRQIPGLDIAGFMEPAQEVGGDYYDVLSHNGRVKIGIGDVTGHGLESGMLMVMVQTAVRTLLLDEQTDGNRFLNAINKAIYHNVQRMNSDKNLTLALLDYEVVPQGGRLQMYGQHEEAIVVREGGQIERIDTIDLGFPIGLEPDIAEFVGQTGIDLAPGDSVVLYTDGITEAENPAHQQYGIERLCEMVRQNWHQSADRMRELVIEDVRRHIGTQRVFDDFTLLVLKQK
ncbi:putative PAS/PAC sensor protein [Thalassoporum mexicanum PCC 7367]|uniref:SpoIIE family protein phosphatase n=1 Tax=Thalassoporum mexicanum TaxID=3457544 RepID=UPI00029FD231|nr:SpoIIE family protein phosphatase [Pseudanabaena sp. PCC 7367]AFY68477.1 putative PAS/PAC sensor protein [Pseudanabaena sp. PCC 7367]